MSLPGEPMVADVYGTGRRLFPFFLGNANEWQKTGTKELLASFPTPRDAMYYIMDTFPIVKRKDEAAHGTYRTIDTILASYDAMQTAICIGHSYQTLSIRRPVHLAIRTATS